MNRFLISVGSLVSIAFGCWHFFVPSLWQWYQFIDPQAPELVTAVRAINVFFSMTLVLFGLLNIAFIFHKPISTFHLKALLLANVILWVARVTLQVRYPQGSEIAGLQWIMLSVFAFTLFCFFIPLTTWKTPKTYQ